MSPFLAQSRLDCTSRPRWCKPPLATWPQFPLAASHWQNPARWWYTWSKMIGFASLMKGIVFFADPAQHQAFMMHISKSSLPRTLYTAALSTIRFTSNDPTSKPEKSRKVTKPFKKSIQWGWVTLHYNVCIEAANGLLGCFVYTNVRRTMFQAYQWIMNAK